MKNSDLVSIAMATYNGERYLQQQLDSIINQTYEDIQIIIVDDCSTDRTKEILADFQEKYQHCVTVYYNQANLGLVKNFEKALGYCTGDFIALCDQDDVWELHKVERLVREIDSYSLIYSDVSLIDADGQIISRSRTIDYGISNHSDIGFREMIFKSYIIGCSAMFRSELLLSAMPIPQDALFHDWWIAIFASKSNGIKYLHEPLVSYRQHSSNVHGHKKGGFIKNIVNTLMRSSSKTNELTRKLRRLKLFDDFDGLDERDKSEIKILSNHYKSYLESNYLFFHWFSTIILLRKLSVKKSSIKRLMERIIT